MAEYIPGWILPCCGVLAAGMAWAIGAQDVSNALGTSVGAGAVTVKQAVVIAAVAEFAGSLAGGSVAGKLATGILDRSVFSPAEYAQIMTAVIGGGVVWLAVATYACLPVSTTHSLIGALLGIGLLAAGPAAVQWGPVTGVITSWVTSPLMGGTIAYVLFAGLHKHVLKAPEPEQAALRVLPYYTAGTVGVCAAFLALVGPSIARLSPAGALVLGLIVAAVTFPLAAARAKSALQQIESDSHGATEAPTPSAGATVDAAAANSTSHDEESAALIPKRATRESEADTAPGVDKVQEKASPTSDPVARAEDYFTPLMVLTACVVSFAHGSNDVSNAIGPFVAVLQLALTGGLLPEAGVPTWVLILGGLGIVVGLATYGYKVMATVGEKIARLTRTRGYAAQVGTAFTVLSATQVGFSVSTTHCLIGAIAGVALVEGRHKLNVDTLKKIAMSWIVTIPAAAFAGIVLWSLMPKA